MNSDNTSNTYDKSTLDAKFEAITDKLSEIKQSLSSCVTKSQHDKDIKTSVNNALANLPKHYVTYEELLVYLKDYVTEESIVDILQISEDTVTMINNCQLGLQKTDDKLSLFVVPPYVAPTASISVNPQNIEYGQDSNVTLVASVSDANKIKSLLISGGNLLNEDVTSTRTATDIASNTQPTNYILQYTNDKDQTNTASCSTIITKRILYGNVEPTASIFSSIESMKAYGGNYLLTTSNPRSISITQSSGQYGWIATPWKINSFTDASINLPGGWVSNVSDGTLSYTQYTSPYGDGQPYYVYRTSNTNLGTINWNIN